MFGAAAEAHHSRAFQAINKFLLGQFREQFFINHNNCFVNTPFGSHFLFNTRNFSTLSFPNLLSSELSLEKFW
jgi:hypothetical protein